MRFSVFETDVMELGCHKPDWGHLPHSPLQMLYHDMMITRNESNQIKLVNGILQQVKWTARNCTKKQAATSKVKTAILYLKSSDRGRGQRQAQSKQASLDIAIVVVGKKRKRETNPVIVMRLNERYGFHVFPNLQLSIFTIKEAHESDFDETQNFSRGKHHSCACARTVSLMQFLTLQLLDAEKASQETS